MGKELVGAAVASPVLLPSTTASRERRLEQGAESDAEVDAAFPAVAPAADSASVVARLPAPSVADEEPAPETSAANCARQAERVGSVPPFPEGNAVAVGPPGWPLPWTCAPDATIPWRSARPSESATNPATTLMGSHRAATVPKEIMGGLKHCQNREVASRFRTGTVFRRYIGSSFVSQHARMV